MLTFDAHSKFYHLKTILSAAICILFAFIPSAYSQTYFAQKAKGNATHRIKPTRPLHGDTIDIYPVTLDYYSADLIKFPTTFISQQGQLMNKYYNFPTDTTNSYKGSSTFFMNYACINSISVAFDSLYDINSNISFFPDTIANLRIITINVPIIQVHHTAMDTAHNDTLEIQLNQVDAYGYPTNIVLVDTLIIGDNIGDPSNSDQIIKTITWNLNNFQVSGSQFAVTINYFDQSKQDSCWFIYGYNSFNSECNGEPSNDTVYAIPTDFSRITTSPKPLIANSFEIWNQYYGRGFFPTTGGDNIFFPCDSTEKIFHPGIDGINYFQDIHIFLTDTISVNMGVQNLHATGINVSQNYPNPFSSATVINYNTTKQADINFKVSDITGREILSQNYGRTQPGTHSISLDGTALNAGVYFYTINASGTTVTKKMVVY